MVTVNREFLIEAGTPTVAQQTITLLNPGIPGDGSALRKLTHPTGATFPQITYRRNPDDTTNFLRGQIVAPPIVDTQLTLGNRSVTRFERSAPDMTFREIWNADRGLSMIGNMLVELLNYWINPLPVGQFLRWTPCDTNIFEYDVVIVNITAGGRNVDELINIRELVNPAFGHAGPTSNLDGTVVSGILNRTISVEYKVIEEFAI